MTEAAISGGAPAPAEHSGAPITAPVDLPNALGSQTPVAEKPVVDPKVELAKNAGEAIRKANETLKAKEAEKAAEPAKPVAQTPDKTPAAKVEPTPETGKPVAAQPAAVAAPVEAPKPVADPNSPHRVAPSRFDDAAKAEWDAAPESIKGAVHRTIRELEQGHQKYKGDAEAFNEVREYHEMARKGGTDLKTALTKYVGMENELRRDPIAGLQAVIANLGLKGPNGQPATLRDIAAHVLNQKPDQIASRQEATISQLNQQISELKQQIGGVTQHIQQQRVSGLESDVASFQADPNHSRFDELAPDIKFFLESGRVDASLPPKERLSEAYKLAERLNPVASAASANGAHTPTIPLAQTQTPTPTPANPAGQKSVSGAPSTGSDPAPRNNGPVPSIREALKRGAARAG